MGDVAVDGVPRLSVAAGDKEEVVVHKGMKGRGRGEGALGSCEDHSGQRPKVDEVGLVGHEGGSKLHSYQGVHDKSERCDGRDGSQGHATVKK